MNIVEKAMQRAALNKEKYSNSHNRYTNTIYIAIQENDYISCLTDSSVLEDAKCCILVHRRSKLAETNYYDWFDVDYIDKKVEPYEGCLDKDYSLQVQPDGSFRNQKLTLESSDGVRYSWFPSWNNTASIKDCFQSMWNLYNELKKVETKSERALIVQLYQKDEKILQQKKEIANFSYANALLEKERDMYKGLLDDIKKLLLK